VLHDPEREHGWNFTIELTCIPIPSGNKQICHDYVRDKGNNLSLAINVTDLSTTSLFTLDALIEGTFYTIQVNQTLRNMTISYFYDPSYTDCDADGVVDRLELLVFPLLDPSNPTDVLLDQDNDGFLTIYEVNVLNTNPFSADTDADGLDDYREVIQYKTNPLATDSDGDGFSDGIEITFGTDPNNSSSNPLVFLIGFPIVVILSIVVVYNIKHHKSLEKSTISTGEGS
jgi:hypothetical protein